MKIENLTTEQMQTAANMLKAIAHPVRMAILSQLEGEEKLNVTEIHKNLKIEQSSASHHLGILKDKGVLAWERNGKNTFYSLKHEKLANIVKCVSSCVV